ncbi:MAG: GxxExxY protein [Phycisphaerae bacterium]|nr:GxxExxY protein [Phycisphaerae bacterium]
MADELLFKDECYAIQGAVFDVYKELGVGFLESVYQECLEKELLARHIPFESQRLLRLMYKGQVLEQTYKADLVCYDRILVEIKAVKSLTGEHRAQVMNYLKGTGLRLGLLANFGSFPRATVERVIF